MWACAKLCVVELVVSFAAVAAFAAVVERDLIETTNYVSAAGAQGQLTVQGQVAEVAVVTVIVTHKSVRKTDALGAAVAPFVVCTVVERGHIVAVALSVVQLIVGFVKVVVHMVLKLLVVLVKGAAAVLPKEKTKHCS